MNYRSANRGFLYIVCSSILISFIASYWIFFVGNIPVWANNFVLEMSVLIPVVIVMLFHGEKIFEFLPFKRIKISTVLLIIVFTLLLFPLVSLVNSISMLFVDNTISSISGDIVSLPMGLMLFSMGIFGPFVEEFVFRGFFLQSYKRSGRIVGSILLSAFLFGVIHLNLNQFMYAAVMGVMLALLVEATGSVLASFICHAVFNSLEVLLMYSSKNAIASASDMVDGGNTLFVSIALLFLISLVTTPLAICLAYKISSIEGRNEEFAGILNGKKQGYKLITIPLIIAVAIAGTFIFVYGLG